MDRSQAYDILGIRQDASEDEIKAAYRALAQKYNVDNYEAGPLRDDAKQKMNELNEAFDILMSFIRTGSEPKGTYRSGTDTFQAQGKYPEIRSLINSGRVDDALSELNAIPSGINDAEWNFLMGSVYYYKGYLDQALSHFQTAVNLSPGNREYQAALRNLQGNAEGNMQGSPFAPTDPSATALNCVCNACALICCMETCCGSFRS